MLICYEIKVQIEQNIKQWLQYEVDGEEIIWLVLYCLFLGCSYSVGVIRKYMNLIWLSWSL